MIVLLIIYSILFIFCSFCPVKLGHDTSCASWNIIQHNYLTLKSVYLNQTINNSFIKSADNTAVILLNVLPVIHPSYERLRII